MTWTPDRTRRHRVRLAMLALTCLVAGTLPGALQAQPVLPPHALPGAAPAGGPGVPDVAPGAGTIRGRVVHESDASAGAGVPVILYALSPGGTPGLRGVETDADGAFAFENIATDPDTVYLVGARYREVPFGLRVTFGEGELERIVELPIADPATDTAPTHLEEVTIRVDPSCEGIYVREAYVLENPSDRVIYIPQSERAEREPILRIELPEGAASLESAPEDNLEWTDGAVRFWGPLRPGRDEIVFAYGISSNSGAGGLVTRMDRRITADTKHLRLLSHPSGARLRAVEPNAVALRPTEPFEVEGVLFDALEATELAAGDRFALEIATPAPAESMPGIEVQQGRMWLELDGAALSVDEQYQLTASEPLASETGAPLLCMALPGGAEELRFSQEALDLGLSRDASGALAVRGPIPAGVIDFALRYRIPVDGGEVVLSRSFPLPIPLLTVFAADTGLAVETNRLHRRRFMRTSDRTYLHLEGFEIAADEQITLGLAPLPTRRRLPGLAASTFAVGGAMLAIGFLIAPLRGGSSAEEEDARPGRYFAEERQAVLATIRSLEDDFETGKVSDGDYTTMRQQLRAEAVSLLRSEREAESQVERPSAGQLVVPAPCAACGAAVPQDARFCAQCGEKLEAAREAPPPGRPERADRQEKPGSAG